MNYDQILEELGEFGPWQLLYIVLLFFPAIACGTFVLTYSFTGLEPERYRCAIPGCDSRQDFNAYNDSIYQYEDGEPNYCSTKFVNVNTTSINGTCPFDAFDENVFVKCNPNADSLVLYDTFDMENSIVTEFNLICDQQFKVALVGSIYMAGLFFGSVIFGFMGDRFGRKIALSSAMLVAFSGSLAGAFVHDYISYCVTRFVTALGTQGIFLQTFALSVELVGNKRKTLVGNLAQGLFAVGEALVGLVGLGVREWRTLQIVLSAPFFALLGLYFVLPESPRWLIANEKYEEARFLMIKAAKRNKKNLSEELLKIPEASKHDSSDSPSKPSPEHIPTGEIFRNPTMRKNILIMFVNWIVITLSYYGISMAATGMGNNTFVSSILSSLIEIPSYIFCTLVMDRWGRKPIFSSALLLTGFACIPVGFLEEESVGKIILPLIGKFGASSAFSIVYLYTAELYPTAVRSTVTGLCSMMARIGGIAAPQVAIFLPTVTADYVPFIVLGGSALVGGILSLLLPETLGFHLPETIEDVERFKTNEKSFFSCWSTYKLRQAMEKNDKNKNYAII